MRKTSINWSFTDLLAALGMLYYADRSCAAFAATISRSVDVKASVSAVWSLIGPFCAIKDWLPPVGQCIEDGKTPSTRILVTKDGKAAFVETQTRRSDAEHSYSYTFLSSPLPVSNYKSTIKVTAKDDGSSTITWSGCLHAGARTGKGRQRGPRRRL